jgi:nitrogen regulatory protein P-II 1
MQRITAVVTPHRADAVRAALRSAGIGGMTIDEVRGFGRQHGHTEIYRGAEYRIDFVPKVRIEVICADDRVDELVDVVTDAARTGSIGDGKIWTTPLEHLVRIRTGEEGDEAI